LPLGRKKSPESISYGEVKRSSQEVEKTHKILEEGELASIVLESSGCGRYDLKPSSIEDISQFWRSIDRTIGWQV